MSVEKNVPEIRFKGFEGEWKGGSLGELGSVATNKRIFIHQTSLIGDVPFYKIGTFGREPKMFISQELFDDYKKRYPFPEKGDLLFSVIGSIGRVVEYTGKDEYFQDSNVVWLQHNGSIVNSFLKQFYSVVEWEGIEGSTIKHLYNRTILGTKIQMPTREEQTKIGNTFQKLDSLINQHQQKHDKLSSIKKAMLEKMFPKQGETISEIRFKGFSGEWEDRALREICTYHSSLLTVNDAATNGVYPLYDANKCIGYTDKNIQYTDYITIIKDGSGVGRVRVLPKKSSFIATMGAIKAEKSDLHFLYCCLLRIDFSKHISGATIPHVYFRDYGSENCRAPIFEEQTKIGNYFQKLDALINQHKQQITKLNNIKQACLSKMFV